MTYSKYESNWQDGHAGGTPIVADALDHMEQGITDASHTAPILVAANNARTETKAMADYVCDGTDDHVQIQAAIDASESTYGGKVLLSEGQFIIGATVVLPATTYGFHLAGLGREATQVRAKTSLNSAILELAGPHQTLSDMTIDGNKANQASGNAVILSNTKYILNRVQVTNAKVDGIAVEGDVTIPAAAGKMTDCYVLDCDQDGISYTTYAWDSALTGCWVGNSGRYGVYSDSGTQTLSNCHIWGSQNDGVRFNNGVQSKAMNCYIESNGEGGGGGRGIRIGSSADSAQIVGCHLWKNSSGGIYGFQADHVLVSDCMIVDNGGSGHGAGVEADTSNYWTVTNNQFYNRDTTNQGRPFVCSNGSDYTVYTGNMGRAADHFTGGPTITGKNSVAKNNPTIADYPAAVGSVAFRASTWYMTQSLPTATTLVATEALQTWVPFYVGMTTRFDNIGCLLTSNGAAGAVARLGIYYDDGFGAPGTLLADYGTVATSSGATVIKSISTGGSGVTLPPALYWLSMAIQGASGGPGTYGATFNTVSMIGEIVATNSLSTLTAFTLASVTGAFANATYASLTKSAGKQLSPILQAH